MNRVYVRCGMVSRPGRRHLGQPSAPLTRSTTLSRSRDDDSTVVGTVTGVDHERLFSDPEDGSSLWTLAVDPASSLPGVGAALTRALAAIYRDREPRLHGFVRWLTTTPPRSRCTRSWDSRGAGDGGQSARTRSTNRCSPTRRRRSTTSIRTRASSPTRPCAAASGWRCSTPRRVRCGCHTAGAASSPESRLSELHIRGGDEPMRRQAIDPSHRRRSRNRRRQRTAGHLRRGGLRVPRRGGRRRGQSRPAASRARASRSASTIPTNSTRRWPGPVSSIPTCSSSSARRATTCGWS